MSGEDAFRTVVTSLKGCCRGGRGVEKGEQNDQGLFYF